jgi:OmcA/MtrC family decaheme c-type cytochrome
VGPAREAVAVEDPGASVETCTFCHATGGVVPVSDVNDPNDAHYVDLDPQGPQTPAGYRQLRIDPTLVDVTGERVIIDFTVTDENTAAVDNIFASDGRFSIAKLSLGPGSGDPADWQNPLLAQGGSERFTTTGGSFQMLGGGAYRYSSVFDPTTIPVVPGDTLRVAVQISAGDIPAGNGWCDFDADLGSPNACPGSPSITRDIVQTSVCNVCHGATSDTQLSFHGGGRTEVEYCVTCHTSQLGDSNFPIMVHKIHNGKNLMNPLPSYPDGTFTKDIDDCTTCHAGNAVDVDNWAWDPSKEYCSTCHEDVNFDTGANHSFGGQQPTNALCSGCHPAHGPVTPFTLPIGTVHQGPARAAEAGRYRGATNGFSVDAGYDPVLGLLTIDYSVTRDGAKVILQSDPAFGSGASLAVKLSWSTQEYTNTGSGNTPAQPVSFDALDVGGVVSDLGGGIYRIVTGLPAGAFGTLTAALEGRALADVLGDGNISRIPIQDVQADVYIDPRAQGGSRRRVIDVAKCNQCHDASGAGITFHGDNRSNEMNHCASCHNPDATDISQRPADPATTPDGKKEEAIDFKRMIHQIHSGMDLVNGIVLYGFGETPHDYSDVDFLGNRRNCLTCHDVGTYSAEQASVTLASTIDTGPSLEVATDDLNISQTAAACSSCHDDVVAKNHMLLNGASFMALDENISQPGLPETTPLPGNEEVIPAPEPGSSLMLLAGCCGLGALHRLRRRQGG